jgi:hypothetical protein
MILVGSILRYYFNLCAAGAPELCVVGVGRDAHFLDGFFVGRDGRGSAPIQAVNRDTVNLEAVRSVALAVGVYLHLIFGLEDARVALRSPWSLTPRGIRGVATGTVRGVAKNTWGQSQELERIPTE